MRKPLVALDDGTGLVAVQTRHEDVAKNDVWMRIADFGEGVKTVFCQEDLMTTLFQEDFGAAPDGVAVINHEYFQSHPPSSSAVFQPVTLDKSLAVSNAVTIRVTAARAMHKNAMPT